MKKLYTENLNHFIFLIIEKLKNSAKIALKKINELIFLIFDSLLLLLLKIVPFKNKKTIKKVCVRLDGLGDAILFVDYINANNKDETLYIISDLQKHFIKNLKNVKNYFVIERTKFKINIFYRLKILLKISRMKCDEIINPVFSKEILLEDSIVRFINSKKKIGLMGNLENSSPFFKYIGDKFYDQLLKIKHNKSIHELYLNHEIIKLTTNSSAKLCQLPINLNTLFANKRNSDFSNHIMITCGSRKKSKNLPEIYYHRIIKYILKKSNYKIIITGHSLYEKHICNRIEKKFGARIINLHGKTSVTDMFDIATSCQKIITNDTFMVHISNMLNCKTIMFKKMPVTYNRFLPYPDSFFLSKNMRKVFQLNDDLYNNFEQVLSSINMLIDHK